LLRSKININTRHQSNIHATSRRLFKIVGQLLTDCKEDKKNDKKLLTNVVESFKRIRDSKELKQLNQM
jgi:hypothetical protein